MEAYAIFLDIDGTLTYDCRVPPENIDMIEKARKAGHYVFYNTGRSYGFIPDYCKESLVTDGFVAGIGSHVVCGDTVLKSERLSVEEAVTLSELFAQKKRPFLLEGENESVAFYEPRNEKKVLFAADTQDYLQRYSSLALTKGYISGVVEGQQRSFFEENYSFYQHPDYAEFSHKGCSKSEGMKLILEHLHIPKQRCIAVGDSLNDIDMLRFAGISVAMGNAGEEIRQLCTHVTDTNEHCGVAKILQHLLDL